MTGHLIFQQHFLPLYFGHDSNLLNYVAYEDFKEEYSIVSNYQSRKFNSKKFANKLLNDLKNLGKRTSSLSIDDVLVDPSDEADDGHQYNDKDELEFDDNDDDDDDEDYEDLDNNDNEEVDGANGAPSSLPKQDPEDLQLQFLKGNATLKEVQELLATSEIIGSYYTHPKKITLILSNGTIIHVILKNIFGHEYLYIVNKLFNFNESISSVAYSRRYILFLFPDNRLIVARKNFSPGREQHGDSDASDSETEDENDDKGTVEISTYKNFLPILNSKKLSKIRHLVLNDLCHKFIIWWTNSKDEIFPWTPKPEQRANILIYSLDESEPVLQHFIRSEHCLLDAKFANRNSEVLTLESNFDSNKGRNYVTETIHQQVGGGDGSKQRKQIIIPIPSTLTCYSYNHDMLKLAIGCCDSSIIVHSKKGKITQFTKCAFNPTALSWHPDSYLFLVVGEYGQFQVFDIALFPILLSSTSNQTPSMTQEIVPSVSTEFQIWAPIRSSVNDSYLLMKSKSGELSLLRLALGRLKLLDLIKFYLVDKNISAALRVLKNVQWNSEQCLQSMYCIFGDLIIKDYSEEIELNLEHLMVSYFAPKFTPNERCHEKHLTPVCVLAKKFFMWLVRAGRHDRALEVAVSLKNDSLLKHLRQVGLLLGNQEIAEKADECMECHTSEEESYGSGDSESCSCSCSCSCCSYSSDENPDSDILDNVHQQNQEDHFITLSNKRNPNFPNKPDVAVASSSKSHQFEEHKPNQQSNNNFPALNYQTETQSVFHNGSFDQGDMPQRRQRDVHRSTTSNDTSNSGSKIVVVNLGAV